MRLRWVRLGSADSRASQPSVPDLARSGSSPCRSGRRACPRRRPRQAPAYRPTPTRSAGRPGKCRRVAGRIAPVEQQHGQTLPARQKVALERAEGKRPRTVRRNLLASPTVRSSTKKHELHHTVVRAPRWRLRAPTMKPAPLIERRARVEIAHRMNDMVEAARHPSNSVADPWFGAGRQYSVARGASHDGAQPYARRHGTDPPCGWPASWRTFPPQSNNSAPQPSATVADHIHGRLS